MSPRSKEGGTKGTELGALTPSDNYNRSLRCTDTGHLDLENRSITNIKKVI